MLTKPKPGVKLNPLHPLSKGLVGCWLFNEGAGNKAYDISGNKNHGVLENMLPNVQGSRWGGSKFGGGVRFDGVDDYVDCGNDSSLNVTDAITIEAWVKTSSTSSMHFLNKNALGTNAGYNFQIVSEKAKAKIADGSDIVEVVSTTNVNDDSWHHLVTTADFTTNMMYIYVDSVQEDSEDVSSIDSMANTDPLFIGANINNYANFNGFIDGVKVYNRALSAEEVKQLYHDPFCNLSRRTAWQPYVHIPGDVNLAGVIDGVGSLSGLLCLTLPFSGQIQSISNITGLLGLDLNMVGNISSLSELVSALKVVYGLSGDVTAQSAFSGGVQLIQNFSGEISAVSNIVATLNAITGLSGVVNASAQVDGTVYLDFQLSGDIDAVTTLLGSLWVGELSTLKVITDPSFTSLTKKYTFNLKI